MAGKTKASAKKDLEAKIAELEEKLTKLSTQLEAKPTPKPAEVKPAETKPAERPAATTKPKGTLPKGFEEKPAEVPKPAETTTELPTPTTVQEALENAYMTAPMTSFHDYRAKVTGYSPAPNRYFVRRTAPVGSNQYYATRARIAHHPADKTFGSFSGINMKVEGVDVQTQTQQAPSPEAHKPAKGTLPKGMGETQQTSQQQSTGEDGKSREEKLADYEADYLQRIEQQKIDEEKAFDELLEKEAKARSTANRGTLPKGFEPKPEPEVPKSSRGTLPKGF
jgi:hypothetical protein